MADQNLHRSRSPLAAWTKAEFDHAPELVSRMHSLILDLEAENERLREVAAAVDAHYSASLDFQPAYVRMAREALGVDYDR